MLKHSNEKKKKSESVSCSVISNSLWAMSIAHQALLYRGFSRQEYWSGSPFASPGDLPNPGIEPGSPALKADSLLSEPPRKKAHMGLQKPMVKFSGILQDKNIYTMENHIYYKSKHPTSASSPCQRATLRTQLPENSDHGSQFSKVGCDHIPVDKILP